MARDNGEVATAFEEVSTNTPKVVEKTAKKYGPQRARKQRIAIALSKARKRGANLPNPKLRNRSKSF